MKLAEWRVEMQHLKQARLLDHVDEPCLRLMQEAFEPFLIDSDDILLSPLAPNHYIYLVLSGVLAVRVDSLDGQPVRTIGPGDCAGGISFMDNVLPSASVFALDATVLMRRHRRSLP